MSAVGFWRSCSTPSPSTARSLIRSAWCSSTPPTRICADQAAESTQLVFVQGHSDGGIHAELFQGGDLGLRSNAARGDDRMCGRIAQHSKPFEVRAGHGAFAVHIGAEKSSAKRFELRHHALGLEREALAPAVNRNSSPGGIQGNYDPFAMQFLGELAQEASVHFSAVKRGASNNDLVHAPTGNFFRAGNGSNSAANSNLHSEVFARAFADLSNELVVRAFSHGGIKVDDVQPRIFFEFPKQAKDVGDCQLALPPAYQLNRLSALQVDAGNQHGRRTSTPFVARNSLSLRMG